jgi:hypothetical protein
MKITTAAPNVALLYGFGLLILSIAVSPVRAATVSVDPTTSTVGLGDQVTLDLNISGLTSSQALGSFDITVNYNPSLLSFSLIAFGDPVLGDQLDPFKVGYNNPTAWADGTGTVDLTETSIRYSPTDLLSGQAKNFTLGALTFYGLAAGTTPVTLTINNLADQNGNPLIASLTNSSVTVSPSPVPLPAAGWLLLSGIAVVGALSRRWAFSGGIATPA